MKLLKIFKSILLYISCFLIFRRRSFSFFTTNNILIPRNLTYGKTTDKWISCIAHGATAYRIMINYLTTCINTARVCTRIRTFLIDTCLILSTFRTDYAFWPTSGRCSYVAILTGAYSVPVYWTTLTIGAARRW